MTLATAVGKPTSTARGETTAEQMPTNEMTPCGCAQTTKWRPAFAAASSSAAEISLRISNWKNLRGARAHRQSLKHAQAEFTARTGRVYTHTHTPPRALKHQAEPYQAPDHTPARRPANRGAESRTMRGPPSSRDP